MTTTHDDKAREREQFAEEDRVHEITKAWEAEAGDDKFRDSEERLLSWDYFKAGWEKSRDALSPASSTGQEWTQCVFKGDPPAPYATWPDFIGAKTKTGVFVRAATAADWDAAPAQQVEAEIRDRVLEEAAKAMIHRGWTDSASVIRSLKSAAGSNNGEKAARSVDANELLYEHAKAQETACWCHKCSSPERIMSTMILCPDCGNKRCPKASDHGLACTGSNEPGQPGSVYGRPVSGM